MRERGGTVAGDQRERERERKEKNLCKAAYFFSPCKTSLLALSLRLSLSLSLPGRSLDAFSFPLTRLEEEGGAVCSFREGERGRRGGERERKKGEMRSPHIRSCHFHSLSLFWGKWIHFIRSLSPPAKHVKNAPSISTALLPALRPWFQRGNF